MKDFTRKLMIFGCLLLTGFCFWKAVPGLVGGADASVMPAAQAAISPSYSHKRGITTPIQDMRPGMRIVGRNPNRLETESTIDPTPEGWRLLSVRMLKQDGSYFEAELLRPLSWIRQHRAKPGATIQLNMPEMYVVGAAEVLSISDCPPIDPGEGPVVLSTFKNISDNVLNIYVEGEETPIGVTAGHPIWSEDRQAFIHSEKLTVGEKLRSTVGRTVRITTIEPRAGPEAVYNLEVAGEHVYSVTDSGLLVHNTGPCDKVLITKINGVDLNAPNRTLMQGGGVRGVEPASEALINSVRSKGRTINFAEPGSDSLRFLDHPVFGGNASVSGERFTSILLRRDPRKIEVLEEFLHGTQFKTGRVGSTGQIFDAERHVKDFMIRHRKLLGLSDGDVSILRQMLEGAQ